MFDWTLSFGNALTIFILGLGGIGFVYTIRGRVDTLSGRLYRLEDQLKRLVDVLVQQGRHEERMNAMDLRLSQQGQRIDEITKRFNNMKDDNDS